MFDVDRFEGIAWLDWWANAATNLGVIEVSVVITATEAGWEAHGRLNNDEDREGFQYRCDLDPVFTLHFAENATVEVTVRPTDGYRRFTMTEYRGPLEPFDRHRQPD